MDVCVIPKVEQAAPREEDQTDRPTCADGDYRVKLETKVSLDRPGPGRSVMRGGVGVPVWRVEVVGADTR